MKSDIVYHWATDHLRIDLGNRIEPRIRAVFWMELLFTSGLASVCMIQAFTMHKEWVHWCTISGAITLYLLAAIRFVSRIYLQEQLILTETHLILVEKNFFSKKEYRYNWTFIGPLHYVGKDRKTDHPLKGKTFDYFGFETHEHLIQSLHQDGSIYFNYQSFPVRFGRGVYSWHAEEIVRMMKLYMGDTLQLSSDWRRMMQEQEWDDRQQS